jgi:hypothetical protein
MTEQVSSPMPLIQYRTVGGAIVTVTDAGHPSDDYLSTDPAAAQCGGCLESLVLHSKVTVHDARSWATGHAQECTALPRFVSGGDVDNATWTALAEEYAARAVRLLEGKPSTEDRLSTGTRESRDPLGSAQTYAGIADVYARLASR